MYDPLIGQWISEDPIGFGAGDSNQIRYVLNSVLALVDPTGHEGLKAVRVGQPKILGDFGAAELKIDWELSVGKLDGWVVQHVIRTQYIVECGRIVRNEFSDDDFWEAWKVTDGVIDRVFEDLPEGSVHDTFRFADGNKKTAGVNRITAVAKFVPAGDEIDPSKWGRSMHPSSGNLFAWERSKRGWLPGWDEFGGVTHSFMVEYDDVSEVKIRTRIVEATP